MLKACPNKYSVSNFIDQALVLSSVPGHLTFNPVFTFSGNAANCNLRTETHRRFVMQKIYSSEDLLTHGPFFASLGEEMFL